jgi:hypothetical protein
MGTALKEGQEVSLLTRPDDGDRTETHADS